MGQSPSIRFEPDFLEQFELLSELSSGGMGVVYLARQKSLDRQVALKFPLLTDLEALARFEAEARMLASLNHPNIVQIYSWGSTGGHPFLVEELIEGVSLRDQLARRRCLPQREALGIARDIADALVYVHHQGMVHRDLKPSNILIAHETAKLIDFGIARDTGRGRLTRAGVILGTPEYLAPEVLDSDAGGPAVDVYALGTILFEMLTGDLPLPAPDVMSMLRRRSTEDAPLVSGKVPTVTPALEALIGQMLGREPGARPGIAADVLPALEAQLAEFGGAAGRARAAPRPTVVSAVVTDPAPEPDSKPTSLGMIRPASGESKPSRPAATVTVGVRSSSAIRPAGRIVKASPPSRSWAAPVAGVAALMALAALVGAGAMAVKQGSRAERAPVAESVSPRAEEPGRSAVRQKLESLAREAETTASDLGRMSAFYRLLSELEEAGSGALGVVEPERLARVRASLLRVSEGRETAVAALLRLLDAGPSALPRIGRKLAARDLATLYTREAMSHLLERLTPLDLRATGMNLGVRFSRLGEKDVAGLKTESLEFAATPAGALWGALEEYVPRLLTSPEVPPETRQAVASKVLAAQGIRLLYERAGLPSPIDPARAFTGTITPTFSEVPKGVSRTLPAEQVAGLAGYSGPAIDLIKNDRENAAYVHKDAQAWYMAAVAVDHSTPGLKESDRVPAFTVPLEGGRDSAGDTCFLAWLIDVDPEDAFALNITPSSGSGLLSLSLVRPDCPGDTEGEFLVSVRVSGKLLPPGRYGAVLTVRRLLTQRRFLESQDRMRSILLRLILCSPR